MPVGGGDVCSVGMYTSFVQFCLVTKEFIIVQTNLFLSLSDFAQFCLVTKEFIIVTQPVVCLLGGDLYMHMCMYMISTHTHNQ